MKICPKCGTKGDVKFCPECGTEMMEEATEVVANDKVCPNCGFEGDVVFCPECGTKMAMKEDSAEKVYEQIQEEQAAPQDPSIASAVSDASVGAAAPINAGEETSAIQTENPIPVRQSPAEAEIVEGENPLVKSEQQIVPQPLQYEEAPYIEVEPPKKKKKTGLIIGIVAAVVVAAVVGFLFAGGGGGVITKDIKEGVEAKTLHNLNYQIPTSWKQDETYENDNAFYETQKFDKKGDGELEDISCYVNYCGESRYYGNSLDDYNGATSGYGEELEGEVTVEGATGKVTSATSTDADNEFGYIDTYFFEADGSIFSVAFYTQENSHDTNGMNELVNMIDFTNYKTNVSEVTAKKGKFLVSCDAIMREIISTANKDSVVEGAEIGTLTYEESSTKGGALCYGILEDDASTGITVSFYKDTDREKSVKSYDDIPKSMAVANSLLTILNYDDTINVIVNGAVIQVVGDVNYDQGSSDYTNKINDATGLESLGYYTNSMELNGFDIDFSATTKDDIGVYMNIY